MQEKLDKHILDSHLKRTALGGSFLAQELHVRCIEEIAMIRLIIQSQTAEEVAVEVHGWVSGEDVEILEGEGSRLLQESRRLTLHLDLVQFIDEEGIELLQRWSGERLELRGGSLFIRGLLEEHGLA